MGETCLRTRKHCHFDVFIEFVVAQWIVQYVHLETRGREFNPWPVAAPVLCSQAK